MKMKTIRTLAILMTFVMVAAIMSCTKTTGDAYKKFQKGGEIVYPGRADSVLAQAGYKRIQLR
jgi:uncharacterized lipoprotein YehR (DUF1307 family)